jgi:hypothetical protein
MKKLRREPRHCSRSALPSLGLCCLCYCCAIHLRILSSQPRGGDHIASGQMGCAYVAECRCIRPYGVVDASGALEVTIRENAVAKMKDHGITPVSWTTVAAELQRDWRPTGKDLGRVFHDHYHSYGLLMDSFEAQAANAVASRSAPDGDGYALRRSRTCRAGPRCGSASIPAAPSCCEKKCRADASLEEMRFDANETRRQVRSLAVLLHRICRGLALNRSAAAGFRCPET